MALQSDANKRRNLLYSSHRWFPMPRFVYHTAGILHGIDVDAESLYEAVAIAVSQLRDDDISSLAPAPTTEFTVLVYRNPTEHRLRLNQVAKWAEDNTRGGRAAIVKRQKVKALLGQSA